MRDSPVGGRGVEDAGSFEEQVLGHRDRLLRVAYLMLGNREDAEDATQRSLLKALQSQSSFRGDAGLYTWLYRILVNQCKDRHKARSRAFKYFVAMPEDFESQIASGRPGPQETLESRELEKQVREALARLPEKFRAILVLRHFEEMSYEQIAEILDCPIGTVRSRLSKARDRLRQIMERDRLRGGPS